MWEMCMGEVIGVNAAACMCAYVLTAALSVAAADNTSRN